MKVSYAQRLEDVHLAGLFEDQSTGVYVDVGGGHPVADNVTFHFYLAGWRGLVIEPQHRLARLYPHVRPRDIVAETLVGRREGQVTFYQVEGMHGFSTAVEANARSAEGYGAKVRELVLPMTTLAGLCKAHGIDRIDILKIDVEGAEADVIAGHDWEGLRPKVVVVEAVAPGTMAPAWDEWEPALLAAGYSFAFFDELNRFYVAREVDHLARRFPPAPRAWDSVAHPYDFGRALDRPTHPDHALATALARGLMALAPTLPPALLMDLLRAGGGLDGTPDEVARRLLGTLPVAGMPPASDVRGLLASDAVRGALGRIAAHYDGGFIGE